MSGPGGGWAQWNDDEVRNRPHSAAPRQAPGPGAGSGVGPGAGSRPDLPGIRRLLARHWVIPSAAALLVIMGAVFTLLTSGGTAVTNQSSDTELCSSYLSAERSWDSYSTDSTEIERLAAVARRHSDEDVRAAGERLDNLSGVFSYGRYESIVRPIAYTC